MMTRMTAEALTRRERISSGLSSVMREGKVSSRRDKLLGISPVGGSPSPLSIDTSDELKEEDMWGGSEDNLLLLEEYASAAASQPSQDDPSKSFVRSSRQWLGLDKEDRTAGSTLGLSAIGNRSKAGVRMIPQVASTYESSRAMMHHHQSAPVNIPDWPKILRSSHKENRFGFGEEADGDDEAPAGEQKLPPHELLAKEYAKSHTAFSVYEGAGRTLKGRDLSRVRNAIWKQTGFLGG